MCRRKRYQLTGATLRASSMYRPPVLFSQFLENRCLVISALVGALLFLSVTLGYVCTRKDTAASTDPDGIMRRPDLVEPSELADGTTKRSADGTMQSSADGTMQSSADGTMQRSDHVEQSELADV
eukprot:697029_1